MSGRHTVHTRDWQERPEQHSAETEHVSVFIRHATGAQNADMLSTRVSCPGSQYGTLDGSSPAVGEVATRVLPENYALCLQALVEGGYDFMLTYHHPSVPVPLDPARFPHAVVGEDRLTAVANPRHLAAWRGRGGRLPLLQYSRGSFLGLLAALAQNQPGAPETEVIHVNENSLAEALKFMALEGHGIAWLPRQLVEADLGAGRLCVVAPELPMEIRLYRNAGRSRAVVERVWKAAGGPAHANPE